MFQRFSRSVAVLFLSLTAFASIATAQGEALENGAASNTIVVDDFENGVGNWTRNDSIKSANPGANVVLVDLVATRPVAGGVPNSNGAGLFTFKTARTNAWASASRRVEGARWAAIGAERLSFWIDAGGETQGTEMVLRARTGKGEQSWTIPLRLNVRSWRRVVIPLSVIKNENGPILPHLKDVYLLQFVQRKTWDSRFFTVDQIQIEGNGKPLSTPEIDRTPAPPSSPPAAPADTSALEVKVDFLRAQGRLRTSANFSVGASIPTADGEVRHPLVDSKKFRQASLVLGPRFIRLEASSLVELVDSQKPSFNYMRLAAAVKSIKSLKAEPLIALSADSVWGLDERAYTAFCAGAARAVPTARYFELPTSVATDDLTAVQEYNRARAAIKAVAKTARIGGTSPTSGRPATIKILLAKASGLDFLSVQHFGAWSGLPSDEALLASAADVSRLRAIAALLDKSKFRAAPIYLTQSNINAARLDGGALPADGRTVSMISAAWWASFMANQSRFADAIVHSDAANPEWGFVNENGEAFPAYYALWMWNSYFASGSARVPVTAPAPILAIASNGVAPAATIAKNGRPHNVLLVNTSNAPVSVKLSVRGFAVLRAVHLRVLEDPRVGVRLGELPKSATQTVPLKPYGIAVVQFVEAPKK